LSDKRNYGLSKTRENHVKTRTQKTLDEMTDAEVLAMALDEMEFLGLIKRKPDADKKPAIGESREARGQRQASSCLALAEHDLRASPAKLRSLDEQVRQLLEQAAPKATNFQ
jgi:DNA-binding HxlR family transcriptional regulator